MVYHSVANPYAVQFDRMAKKDLKEYFEWFLSSIPQRITELSATVRQSPGFEQWNPDKSPASLELLGEWFALQVDTRPRSDEEIKRLEAGPPFPVEVSRFALTNRTLSLAMDIGMYLSQVFLHNHPSLKWEIPLGSRRFIFYGQPVLSGFAGSVPFNPVHTAKVVALRFANQSCSAKELKELYDNWSQKVVPKAS